MSSWIERNWQSLDDWHISATQEQSEDEIAYLFNDIGPLFYVYASVPDEIRAIETT